MWKQKVEKILTHIRIIGQEYFLAEKSGQSLNKAEMVSALWCSRDEIIFHTIVRWKKILSHQTKKTIAIRLWSN